MRKALTLFTLPAAVISALALTNLARPTGSLADHDHTTRAFAGAKVNGGTARHSKDGIVNVLTLSDDFKVPDAPAPHWQVIDSKGNVYLLQRLKIKGDKYNKSIRVPGYIPDVAKVQIWCSWAEALLGEAAFRTPMK